MKYTELSALQRLSRNGLKCRDHVIEGPSVGLKLMGASDYLVNNHKWIGVIKERKSKKKGKKE